MKFCPNCGKSVEENTKFCSNCGCNLLPSISPAPVNQSNDNGTTKKTNILEVLSLVLGVVSLTCALSFLLLSGKRDVEQILKFLEIFTEVFYIKGTGVRVVYVIFNAGFILFLGILSLSFGIKNKQSGMGKTGAILSSIAIILAIIISIKILFT